MRAVTPSVEAKVDQLIEVLKQKSEEGKGFDIYDKFQMLTLDVIAQLSKDWGEMVSIRIQDEFSWENEIQWIPLSAISAMA